MSVYNKINKLAVEVYENNKAQGFWDDGLHLLETAESSDIEDVINHMLVAQRIALIHSELSEALEADRKNLNDDKLTHRKGLEVELADALIRILDMAGGLEMDLGGAIEEKLAYNKTRPFKHGKAY